MALSKEERIQYNRHLILENVGLKGQCKLQESSVLVVGAGGLGCPVLQYLTAAGVGRIGIIDGDTVDQSNLQRQVLYTKSDVGKLKVNVAVDRLSEQNQFTNFEKHSFYLTKDNAIDLFKRYDIIVDGSDNFPTRYLVSDASFLAQKPLVYGSIYKFEGQVSVFNFKEGPTYRCLFPEPPNPEAIKNCSEIGVLGILPGIIGNFQANEAIKIILDIGEVNSGKLLIYNILNSSQTILNFEKNSAIDIQSLEDNYDYFCGIVPNLKSLLLNDIQDKLSEYFLIDVREEWERLEYNIGGEHVPLSILVSAYEFKNIEQPILLYCGTGNRAEIGQKMLNEKFPELDIYTTEISTILD